MPVLYQKYRPERFSEVVGQAHVVRTLQNAIKLGQLSHAYLFCGSRGVGKTTVARILAKAVNCQDPKEADACLECASCLAAAAGSALDIIEIDAASYTGVDNVREIIEQSRLLPSLGKKRVYIIDEVHMLSKPAFNALLKTLEEPPQHVLFILATTESGKVPATILSRLQRFDFFLHSQVDIAWQLRKVLELENIKISEEVLLLIASAAGGGMRDALTLLNQVIALGPGVDTRTIRQSFGLPDRELTLRLFELMLHGTNAELVEYFQDLQQSGLDTKSVVEDALEVARLTLTQKLLNEPFTLLQSELSAQDLMYIIRLLLRAHKEIASSPDPTLPLMMAAMEASLKFISTKTQVLKIDDNHPVKQSPSLPESLSATKESSVSIKNATIGGQLETESAVDLAALQLLWPQICDKVAEANVTLANLLRQTRISAPPKGGIDLCVRYNFHKKQLEQPKYLGILHSALLACGMSINTIQASVSQEDTPQTDGIGLSAALQVLGGEIVE